MKIKLVVLLVLTAAVATTGGSATPVTGAVAAPRRPAAVGRYSTPESTADPFMTRATYLLTIKGLLAGRNHVNQTDAEYIQGGRDICADIDSGATWSTFAAQIETLGGGDYAFYRPAIAAAVYTFCPEDTGILP